MNKLRWFVTVAGVAIVILSLVASSCAPKETAPPSGPVIEEKVTINVLPVLTRTGYYAATDKDVDDGLMAGIKHYNEIEYIPGVEIVAKAYDCGSDAAKTVSAFKMGLGQTPKPVLGFITFSAGAIAAKQLLEEEGLPLITPSSNPMLHAPGSINVSNGARFTGEIAAFVDYYLEYKWKESRPPRFAFCSWDTVFGHYVVTEELINYIKSKGVEYMGEVWIPANCTDVTPQMLQLKEWGVDFINGATQPPDTGVVLKDADRVGLTGKLTLGMGHWVSLPVLLNDIGPLANGSIHIHGYPVVDDFEPWMKEAMIEAGTPDTGTLFFGAGLGWAALGFEGIKRAVEEVGAENVTGMDVYNGFRTIEEYYFPPSWKHSPFNFTEDTVGQHWLNVYEVQNEEPVRVVEDIYCPNLWPGGADVVE